MKKYFILILFFLGFSFNKVVEANVVCGAGLGETGLQCCVGGGYSDGSITVCDTSDLYADYGCLCNYDYPCENISPDVYVCGASPTPSTCSVGLGGAGQPCCVSDSNLDQGGATTICNTGFMDEGKCRCNDTNLLCNDLKLGYYFCSLCGNGFLDVGEQCGEGGGGDTECAALCDWGGTCTNCRCVCDGPPTGTKPPEMVYKGPVIDTLDKIINPVTRILYYGGLFIGLFFIVYSGYKLMISQGNPQATQAAQEQLTSAILGIMFILLSAAILRIILNNIINANVII